MSIMDYNGGTCIGMVGKNCVAIAADKRYGVRFTTVDMQKPKIFKFGPTLFMGLSGLATDVNTVHERMKFRSNLYELEENRKLKPAVLANMLSNFLYQHRFGPYFICPIVVGLDQNAEPFIYEFDMIGCLDRKPDFATGGTAQEQCFGLAEQYWKKDMEPEELFEAISQTLLNGFDRDAYSGWGADVYLIEKDKIIHRELKARLD
ncbi:hypothetical protein GJ496_008611 [Pomphorhynchus laevis]|nr:hypothetical protein GJ496_008611 [Pomphorhynchus laevis]